MRRQHSNALECIALARLPVDTLTAPKMAPIMNSESTSAY